MLKLYTLSFFASIGSTLTIVDGSSCRRRRRHDDDAGADRDGHDGEHADDHAGDGAAVDRRLRGEAGGASIELVADDGRRRR